MIDLRQTKEWADWLGATGWVIDRLRTGKNWSGVFIRKIPLLPIAFLKVQRYEGQIDWIQFGKLKKKHHVLWSVLEPNSDEQVAEIIKRGYWLMKDTYLPGKTRVIDLTRDEKSLLSEMSENFRRILKKSIKLKVKSIKAEEFYTGWKKWAKSYILTKGQFDLLMKTFGNKAEFWAIEKNGGLLSAIMLLFTADTCFYYQTWTSGEGRKSSEHVYLTWETIKRAKKLKKKFYNFEGIQDKRFPMKNWEGFSEFKRRFGGYEIEYPGSYQKWF